MTINLKKIREIFPQAKYFVTHNVNGDSRDNRLPYFDLKGEFHFGNLMLVPKDVHMRLSKHKTIEDYPNYEGSYWQHDIGIVPEDEDNTDKL